MMAEGFTGDRRGNIAVTFALLLPILLGFAGAGADYARYRNVAGDLQDIADAAAIAGAREYVIKTESDSLPVAVAQQIANSALADDPAGHGAAAYASGVTDESSVTVKIARDLTPSLFVGVFKNPIPIKVDATAIAVGGANICVITLEESSSNSLTLNDNSTLSGEDCAIYSNSKNGKGLSSNDAALLHSAFNCTAGGYDGGVGNFDPIPLTDCPPREDPLAMRPEPAAGACDMVPSLVEGILTILTPGVYCGGLNISGAADVTLLPGIYVMRDGDLTISSTARVVGNGVGIYFEGDTVLNVGPDATLSLEAPTEGEMAGMLMFQDRAANSNSKFTISSNNAETLVGTIYLPQGRLFIDAIDPVASESAYTAIVAKRLELTSSVNLVLNSNYKATDVPVPAGIANAGGSVRLRD